MKKISIIIPLIDERYREATNIQEGMNCICLLYTSDAADE